MDTARNQMIDIERLSDLELDAMQVTYEKIKTSWTERQAQTSRRSQNDGENTPMKSKPGN
jgi:low affinity Fe/Cu permease